MILMQLNFNELEYLIGSPEIVENMKYAKALSPFSEPVVEFLNALSEKLRNVREYSDVATFGFWCRRANLLKEKNKYDDLNVRFGKGIVFHSTPSNVPVNFAFSFAAGLLAGNANIVRLPAKDFPQVDIIVRKIKELLEEKYKELLSYICFVKYETVKEITDIFSEISNIRVIWGGDATIDRMRTSKISPRTTEITFSDRHSLVVIDADSYLEAENKERIITGFYNDTYYTDQNACTSPRIVFWVGKEKEKAKEDFWKRVREKVSENYDIKAVQAVGKLAAIYKAAVGLTVSLNKGNLVEVTRLTPKEITSEVMDYKYNSGFFYEADIESLLEITPICDIRCQTITYFGVEQVKFVEFMKNVTPRGVDRIVPIGKSMDFGLVWDGYDLIREMSRKVDII